ncbi:heme-binding protein [Methyloligella sp. 2.7D]|uniref:GlcG/HbpS family heme-binding protein n=1 Tax=unclassified Methyloligella TaxID=2625955 RepID=UPI00157D6DDE|nr:heme-binding protein [Methyloligella sp. GL2]QKP77033.1 heme-binding protein [Methyloligella sp. GL2]
MHVTLEHAEKAIEAAQKKAKQLGIQSCIAVVDSGGNLKAFARMDDAWVGSIDISIKKAKTSCFFGMATGELGKLSQPGKPLYQIEVSNNGLITFPGGIPIVDEEGVLVGAVGSSGSTVENDHEVSLAAVKALGMSEELPEHPWRT